MGVKSDLIKAAQSRKDQHAARTVTRAGKHASKPAARRSEFVSSETAHESASDESDSDSDSSESESDAAGETAAGTRKLQNRQRVLLLASRGITHRHRHLLQDLHALLPHTKKESKLDAKSNLRVLCELADLNNCNNAIFFEARRHEDLYMWLGKTPNGPSAKFQVQNIHTLDELRMTGNHLKGSRPVLSFDTGFGASAHLRLVRELLTHAFAVPRTARRLKPFVDHVMTFSIADGRIWVRNFQIIQPHEAHAARALETKAAARAAVPEAAAAQAASAADMELSEVGPRFCLQLIRIFDGSFGGATLYENAEYRAPVALRRERQHDAAFKYKAKQRAKVAYAAKQLEAELEADPLDEIFGDA